MADTKISNLPAVTDVQDSDEYVIARAGATKKITGANLKSGVAPAGATPSGPAGGVLSGTYPNPGFAADMATQAELNAVAATIPAPGATHIDDLVDVVAPSPADEQNLSWDSSAGGFWRPRTALLPTIVDSKGDLIAGSANDTVARLPVGSNDQVLTADSAQTLGVKWATPAAPASGGMTKLFDSTLGSAATSIDSGAGSIAGSYVALKIIASLRTSESAAISVALVKLNNDTSVTYTTEWVRGLGSTPSASNTANTSGFHVIVSGATLTAGTFTTLEMTINAYAQTTFPKQVLYTYGHADVSGQGNNFIAATAAGYYPGTAAITRIAVLSSSFNLAAGSRLAIWGLS